MAQHYNCKPSDFFDLGDDRYTAFCLDEACTYISVQLKDGKEPKFKKKVKSLSEYYRSLGASNAE